MDRRALICGLGWRKNDCSTPVVPSDRVSLWPWDFPSRWGFPRNVGDKWDSLPQIRGAVHLRPSVAKEFSYQMTQFATFLFLLSLRQDCMSGKIPNKKRDGNIVDCSAMKQNWETGLTPHYFIFLLFYFDLDFFQFFWSTKWNCSQLRHRARLFFLKNSDYQKRLNKR